MYEVQCGRYTVEVECMRYKHTGDGGSIGASWSLDWEHAGLSDP